MALYDKEGIKENKSDAPSICCFSVSCVSMISKLSGIDVMTVSQILSLLEKHDFVKRKEHSRDTRAKAVTLNKKGEEVLQKAVPLIEQIDELFFGKLDDDEEQFKHFLSRLNEK